ncbi:MAG TPA: hypothetical protein VK915_02215 [Gaiellaceae bacterium]|nr:hypothetical protein [Gaiellaceae bacterium]
MSRARRALAVPALALALPAGLVLAVNFASAGELGAAPAVVTIPSQQIAVPVGTTTERTTTGGTTAREDDDDRDDDLPGKCKDPKHRLDPDCDPSAADRDSSGKGSGGDDPDSSGRGSGDDDDRNDD